ncbi:hypothetical protein KEM55_002373 [Ascosphaera atra]|nr:hypothetical protein KEM55_002373 [Ascosphaera atra]
MNVLRRRGLRYASTETTKAAGDISSVFPSLQPGYKPKPLPPRFADLKKELFAKNSDAISRSYSRLLQNLKNETNELKRLGTDVWTSTVNCLQRIETLMSQQAVPSVNYSDFVSGNISKEKLAEIQYRGTVVIRGVLPKSEALDLKQEAREYIAANQSKVKAFPADSPAVYELYWTPSQVKARAHPRMLQTQLGLQKLWHSSNPDTEISTSYPVTYADRFRIRNPGDAKFALGAHADGGGIERWEDPEYTKCYEKILEGNWEEWDAWDVKHRINANMDMYNGAGACSMLRFFQGWLSMSDTRPGEGTLHVCPMVKQASAYTLLRPFFNVQSGEPMLDASFPGAVPGTCQEYNPVTHPHLELETSMVSVPHVEPGDYVAWHCDLLHSVDKEHKGKGDSSVMYIPATPLCEMNAQYLKRQREAALALSPAPDFPGAGGPGEAGFEGAVDWNKVSEDGLQAMGLGTKPWQVKEGMSAGEKRAIEKANKLLFA